MRIDRCKNQHGWVDIWIDGRLFTFGEKYTILEMGYAVLLADEADEAWMRQNGETIPADRENHRGALASDSGMLVTSDPILVTLALGAWWADNGGPELPEGNIPIPTVDEAVEIVRNRKILNSFNEKYRGVVPGLKRICKRKRN